MYKKDILLPDIEAVKKFVFFANQYEFPVTLISGKYIINGKSIMGIFGLDLSQPLQIEVEGNCPTEFIKKIKEFFVPAEAV